MEAMSIIEVSNRYQIFGLGDTGAINNEELKMQKGAYFTFSEINPIMRTDGKIGEFG